MFTGETFWVIQSGSFPIQSSFSAACYPVWSGTFMPYGEEANAQMSMNKYKFTGDEHDSESSLDHTWFRQYESTEGRWITPDPYNGSIDVLSPQSLNRYQYAMNMATTAADSSGLDTIPLCDGAKVFCSQTSEPQITELPPIQGATPTYSLTGLGAYGGASMAGGGGPGTIFTKVLNNAITDFLGKHANWLPGACSGGAFAFAGVGGTGNNGGGAFFLSDYDYTAGKGLTVNTTGLGEVFAEAHQIGTVGGGLTPTGEGLLFAGEEIGSSATGKLEAGGFFAADVMHGLPGLAKGISVGGFVEGVNKTGLAGGVGAYLTFTNAEQCVKGN
jgi:RHS repeat-associated protein